MPLPATVAHLDVDAVADVLINHPANIRNAARALNVPSGDLRKWVLLDERLSAAAVEAIELKLDVAEANLHEALGSEDPRRRDAASMFFLRHMQRAAKRGYAVAALGVEANAEPARPVRYTIRWANEPVDDRAEPDDGDDTVVRDGKRLIMPKYGARETDSIDGAVVEPSVLLEHAVDTGVVEIPVAVEPTVVEPEREPESAAVRYERERIVCPREPRSRTAPARTRNASGIRLQSPQLDNCLRRFLIEFRQSRVASGNCPLPFFRAAN
jgi:hypothetical protein